MYFLGTQFFQKMIWEENLRNNVSSIFFNNDVAVHIQFYKFTSKILRIWLTGLNASYSFIQPLINEFSAIKKKGNSFPLQKTQVREFKQRKINNSYVSTSHPFPVSLAKIPEVGLRKFLT